MEWTGQPNFFFVLRRWHGERFLAVASSRPSRPPCDSSLKSGALEKKNGRRRRETGLAGESPIPAAATPLTGMDSFISISGTFPCSWFSKRSSEEGESKRRSFGIFLRGFDAFRPPAKISEDHTLCCRIIIWSWYASRVVQV
ncbi:PREDICTED: uncharacterized protein LOC101311361 isoform 2 [Fragaria vesca subsp. vesca]